MLREGRTSSFSKRDVAPEHKTRIDDGFVCNLSFFSTQKKFSMQIHQTQTYLPPVFCSAKS